MKIKNLILQIFALLFTVSVIALTPTKIDSTEKIFSLRTKYPSVFPLTNEDKTWIEIKLNELSIREKCAQIIMPPVYRNDFNPHSDSYNKFVSLVKDQKVGGLILFQGGMEEQIKFINQMQQHADIPLLIASDYERGLGTRIDDALEFPHAMALGSTRNLNYAFEIGKVTAIESRQIGVHQNFAPVADINNNPMNPIINIRSYSEDKKEVSKFVKAFIEGSKITRFITTAKHFPGHGNTTIDSHYDLPKIEGEKNYLFQNELLPFIEAIKSGVQSIMVGHLNVPSLEPLQGIPASLSESIVTYLLKKELKFEGLIVTDAMIMDAISKYYSTEDATVAAFEAGNDIILMPEDAFVAIDALENAVNSGRISLERLNESVRKILSAKRWLEIKNENIIDISSTDKLKNENPNISLAKNIAEESINLLKNNEALIPLKQNNYKNVFCITITDKNSGYRTEYFNNKFENRIGKIHSYLLTGKTKRSEYNKVLSEVEGADLVIIPSFIDVKTYRGPVNLSAEQIDFIAGILKKDIPAILISFRNPYLIYLFPEASTYLNSFSSSFASQDAMLHAILGEKDINGKLPVTIPDSDLVYGSGFYLRKSHTTAIAYHNSDDLLSKKADEYIRAAINENLFHGAVVLAGKEGKIFYHKAFGNNESASNNNSVKKDDVFIIGKLSGLFTIASALKLVDEKLIDTDDELFKYFDEFFTEDKRKIKIKDLILQTSGLGVSVRGLKSYWKKDDLIFNLLNQKLDYTPGSKSFYTPLNLILLQEIIEQKSEEKLSEFFEQNFRKKLKMINSGFPFYGEDYVEILYDTPPPVPALVENQNEVISTILKEDKTSSSGFDGFYSNAYELAVFSQMLLQNGYYDETQVLNAITVDKWFAGFKDSENIEFSNNKIELYDNRGCSISIDKNSESFLIILSNADIKNPSNSLFIDFSKKLLQIFNQEINKGIL